MSSTYNKFYKVFNGTDWDIYYIATQAGIVKETSNRMFVHVSGDRFKGTWSGSTNYSIGDIVEKNGGYYIAVAGGTNHDPEAGTWAYWEEFDLSRAAAGDDNDHNNGFMSAAQAYRLANLNLVEVTQEKNGTIQINGVSKQIIPDYTVTGANASSGKTNKVPVWSDGAGNVLGDGVSYSNEGGSGHGGVLVQTKSDGKIDTTFIPDSILNSLKYKGTWDASDGSIDLVSYTPSVGDYFICRVEGNKYPGNSPIIPTWDAANTYYSGQVVINSQGTKYYRSLIDNNQGNQLPGNTSNAYWQLLPTPLFEVGDWVICRAINNNVPVWDEIDNQTKVVSVNGRTGVVSVYQGTVDSGTSYHKGDIVYNTSDNSLYICVSDGAGSNIGNTNYFRRLSSPLYSSTGQATDGAMTQKATTDALSALDSDVKTKEPFRSYVVSSSGNYFQRITGPDDDGEPEVIDSYNVNISAIGSPINWATFASYFVDVLNNVGSAASSVSALFIGSGGANVQTTMSSNLLGWFNFTSNKVKINGVANSTLTISTFKVEALHHDIKVTANITNGRQYEIHIVDTSVSKNWGSVATNGWRVVKDIFDESNTNNVSNALVGDICLETVS